MRSREKKYFELINTFTTKLYLPISVFIAWMHFWKLYSPRITKFEHVETT